jgi:hypothetical protein
MSEKSAVVQYLLLSCHIIWYHPVLPGMYLQINIPVTNKDVSEPSTKTAEQNTFINVIPSTLVAEDMHLGPLHSAITKISRLPSLGLVPWPGHCIVLKLTAVLHTAPLHLKLSLTRLTPLAVVAYRSELLPLR